MSRGVFRLVLITSLATLLGSACAKPVEVNAQKGKELYMAYGCAACHGVDGDGRGPAARLSKIPPRNLRVLSSYVGDTTMDGIARSIEYGMKETGMPAYTDLPGGERIAIATWILSVAEEKK